MMVQLEQQAKRFKTDVRTGWVTKVDFTGPVHKVWVDETKEIHANTVIIATGASAKYLGIPSEQKYLQLGGGVSACAICDGFFYRNQEVVIVGAGDSACEEATYLANICAKVTMLVRTDKFRASVIMENRVRSNSKINLLMNSEIDEVLGDDQVVTGVRIKNNKSGEKHEIPVTGVFIAIGHTPNTAVFKPYIECDEVGYIKNVPGSSKTNVPGVFVCGDAADRTYRQAITAAGTGCMAALDAERYLTSVGVH
jgi:thioredoxin reductase (NADPH)